MNYNNVCNKSQNDWLSASRANSFSYHDPNRNANNSASGYPVQAYPINGNGSASNWLDATKANNFVGLMNGGSSCGMSKVCGCNSPTDTNFEPRGSSIYGVGKNVYTLTGTQPEVLDISGNRSVPVLGTEFMPEGSDIRGMGKSSIKTPFYGSRYYTGNYNMPTLSGSPMLYGSTTLGQLPDLGLNVQPPRQAYWFTGL